MPDPISSVSYRDASWPEQPTERDDFRSTIQRSVDERSYGACHDPTTVVGATLCGDEVAVSNACRRAKPGTVDDALCDDPALQRAQQWLADIAQKAVELLLGAKMSRSR
jgi:hypothetical protein